MIIDTHVHYNLEPLSHDAASHLLKAQEHDVSNSIIVGTDWSSTNQAIAFAQDHDGVYASIGYHPSEYQHKVEQETGSISEEMFAEKMSIEMLQLRNVIQEQKVIAVGETGLDYFRLPSDHQVRDVIIKMQKNAFRQHIELALEFDLPLICHVRDVHIIPDSVLGNAYWDALNILSEYQVSRFTLHCVSGPIEYIKQAVKMGGFMGFDGNITYPKANDIRDIFQLVPKNRRIIETDAPFLPPQQFRGKICEPWMIIHTVEFIEQHLETSREILRANSQQLFSI